MHTVTLIKGDGIGPSIMDEAVKVMDAAGAPIHWQEAYAGLAAVERFGTPLPEQTLAAIDQTKLAFKGPLTTSIGGKGFRSINVVLRQTYELYANVRPAKSWAGVNSRYADVDLVIVRENTEGLYAGLEHYLTPKKDIAESLAVVTRAGSERIIEYAFQYAREHQRRKVTVCHKANILKYTQGLFLDVAREIAPRYPEIQVEEKIIDATCMHLVMHPQQFDVIVCTNMFGDILSDLTAGLVGGLGLMPGANIGKEAALFEAVHGSAPDLAGKNLANPTAVIMAGVMLLRHLGEIEAAQRIQSAVEKVVREGKQVTPDLNPDSTAGTVEMGNAIVAAMA
ncbi:3-isopropylmalate dehydrogenase [Candidatus Methylobacter favarea]|uniref:3-isopropylmalate dehydrogenase n=1 Tax=Candidatus Methylobacter favarea TaxID=2707345 RepID=A0A8S0XEL7_9GAMM|nr:isocitrate/isopropylmalate dehydrogenase family protein [Candidatus Methylobacter favarea]CAA9889882.1 3-isopropylmalate dehydrogenase [Candidatus Methylobacter favarea]